MIYQLPEVGRFGRTARQLGCAVAIFATFGACAAQAAEVCFEAEAANTVQSPWVIGKSPTASGGRCVVQPLLSGRPPQVRCAAIYKVRIPESGTYHVWGRALWPSGCANSVNIVMDGKPAATLGQDGTYNRWHWVELKGASFTLSGGVHTMEMRNREDGPGMDEFFLTTDDDYVPVGIIHTSTSAIAR